MSDLYQDPYRDAKKAKERSDLAKREREMNGPVEITYGTPKPGAKVPKRRKKRRSW